MTPDPTPDTLTPARHVEYRTVDPASLQPYPGNPNVGDVEAVRASLRANGQYRSPSVRLLPDGALEVLAGNTTRLAAVAEGMPLRIEVVDADDETARRIVLADNRTAQLAHYDDALLLQLLDSAELAGTGWNDDALDDLRAQLEETEPAGRDTARQDKGLDDLIAGYRGATFRTVVLGYDGDRYVWVVDRLGLLAEQMGLDANADVVLRLLEQAVNETAPEPTGDPDGVDDAAPAESVDA